jgi:hypothetical protein
MVACTGLFDGTRQLPKLQRWRAEGVERAGSAIRELRDMPGEIRLRLDANRESKRCYRVRKRARLGGVLLLDGVRRRGTVSRGSSFSDGILLDEFCLRLG